MEEACRYSDRPLAFLARYVRRRPVAHAAIATAVHQRDRRCFRVKRLMIKVAGRVLSLVALAALATPVHGEDDFPLVGTYTENQACKTDGSDTGVSRVKITPRDIDSVFGLCTILSKKREGATFVVHVECKGPGGSQM